MEPTTRNDTQTTACRRQSSMRKTLSLALASSFEAFDARPLHDAVEHRSSCTGDPRATAPATSAGMQQRSGTRLTAKAGRSEQGTA